MVYHICQSSVMVYGDRRRAIAPHDTGRMNSVPL
jgi:hypothetical protein